ncbi:MAG TPA: zinc-ribbon domain-containing protein [Firmicutes bacterium]|nr:zinc-ribbon domain-containing protein [Bacillota bacterium]
MIKCPVCGQENETSSQFCSKCGTEILKSEKPCVRKDEKYNNPLDKFSVKFILNLACVFIPILGLILGLLVSLTPFSGHKECASSLIKTACKAWIIWLMIALIIIVITIIFACVNIFQFSDFNYRYYY